MGYWYHKLRKTFSKFYRRYYDLISKFQVGLKSILCHGISEPEFYGDLVFKLKKIVGSDNFSAQFIKIISHYKKIGYNIIAIDCMLGDQPNHGWQFCFPHYLHTGGWEFRLYDGSDLKTYLLG